MAPLWNFSTTHCGVHVLQCTCIHVCTYVHVVFCYSNGQNYHTVQFPQNYHTVITTKTVLYCTRAYIVVCVSYMYVHVL